MISCSTRFAVGKGNGWGILPMETTKAPAERNQGGVACSRQHREEGEAKFLEGDDALQPRLPVALVSRYCILQPGASWMRLAWRSGGLPWQLLKLGIPHNGRNSPAPHAAGMQTCTRQGRSPKRQSRSGLASIWGIEKAGLPQWLRQRWLYESQCPCRRLGAQWAHMAHGSPAPLLSSIGSASLEVAINWSPQLRQGCCNTPATPRDVWVSGPHHAGKAGNSACNTSYAKFKKVVAFSPDQANTAPFPT